MAEEHGISGPAADEDSRAIVGSDSGALTPGGGPVEQASPRHVALAVIVAALGYFVDLFDLVLFSVVRVPSLGQESGIGLPMAPSNAPPIGTLEQLSQLGSILIGRLPGDVTSAGLVILNAQLIGMVLGGVLWGMLGDKRGRLAVLFGSIFVYSIANLANAFVSSVPEYALLRFVAGVGLAGELGAGITLVSELMGRTRRGYGTMIVAGVGLLGPIAAAIVGQMVPWRTAYVIGGVMGLLLLALRIGVAESGLFRSVQTRGVTRGSFLMLLWPRERLVRYLRVIFSGVPIWFVGGIIFVFAPELARAMGLEPSAPGRPAVNPATVIMCGYAGAATGDILSGLISQVLRSRVRTILLFQVALLLSGVAFFIFGGRSHAIFYALVYCLGVATGYWAVFVTVASESFGTNLRATATTTAPNFVRGFAVVIVTAWELLKPASGTLGAAMIVGMVVVVVGMTAISGLRDPFGRTLDFTEH